MYKQKEPFLIFRNSNDPNFTKYYNRYCRILTNVIKIAKNYNNILTCSDNKNKTTWNIIKHTSYIKPNSQKITSINVDCNASFDCQIIVETFNKYMVSVVQNAHVNNHNANPPSNHGNTITNLLKLFNQPFPTINLNGVSSKEIEDITKSLKIKNSHGYDGITTKLSSPIMHYISSPQTYICNRMLSSGIFPTRLKFPEVKPIF